MSSVFNHCVRGSRTQPLICVGCSVHYWVSCAINKGGFFEIAFVVVVVDTHLPRFEALAHVLPHFDALTHLVIRVSSAFIFQTFAEVCYSVFVNRSSFKSVLNFRKAYIFKSLLKSTVLLMNLPKRSSIKSVLKVYTLSKILLWINHIFLWKIRATPGTRIKLGCLARRPLCHKVNLPASCEAQRLLCHKVNLPSCVATK